MSEIHAPAEYGLVAIHEDVRFIRRTRAGVEAELDALAQWLGVDRAKVVNA